MTVGEQQQEERTRPVWTAAGRLELDPFEAEIADLDRERARWRATLDRVEAALVQLREELATARAEEEAVVSRPIHDGSFDRLYEEWRPVHARVADLVEREQVLLLHLDAVLPQAAQVEAALRETQDRRDLAMLVEAHQVWRARLTAVQRAFRNAIASGWRAIPPSLREGVTVTVSGETYAAYLQQIADLTQDAEALRAWARRHPSWQQGIPDPQPVHPAKLLQDLVRDGSVEHDVQPLFDPAVRRPARADDPGPLMPVRGVAMQSDGGPVLSAPASSAPSAAPGAVASAPPSTAAPAPPASGVAPTWSGREAEAGRAPAPASSLVTGAPDRPAPPRRLRAMLHQGPAMVTAAVLVAALLVGLAVGLSLRSSLPSLPTNVPSPTATAVPPTPTAAPTAPPTALPPPVLPSGRAAAAVAASPDGSLVVFGGAAAGGALLGDTWTWRDGGWTRAAPAVAPGPRSGPAMAFDPGTRTTLLYGGHGASGLLRDTWRWDGRSWAQLHPATQPPASAAAAMTSGAPGGGLLLVLPGTGAQGRMETWRWTGSDWLRQFSQAPPAPVGTPLLAPGPGGTVVMVAGQAGRAAQTWTWDGSAWTAAHPRQAPLLDPASAHFALDPAARQPLLVEASSDPGGQVWAWSGTAWARAGATVPGLPAGAGATALVPDAAAPRLLLVALGVAGLPSGATVWAGGAAGWVQVPPAG